jgi:hypothetical protein
MWHAVEIVTCIVVAEPEYRANAISVRPDNGDWAKFEIESPYWVAFKHDTGVLIGGVNADGKSQVTHTFIPGYCKRSYRSN